MSWGPYLWADGARPRSDGLTYECSDLESDFTHPAVGAATKVAAQLKSFFLTDPTAAPWFLKSASGAPTIDSVAASPTSGGRGVRVQFQATASDPDGVREFVWTFGDGTYAYGPAPQKTFNVPGRYPVRLAVVDRAGNAARTTVPIDVGVVESTLPGPVRNLRIIPPPGSH
jgi:PKD repeat protein